MNSRNRADVIFQNGNILTMRPEALRAEALAVSGERIIAVGSSDDVGAVAGPSTRIIDLRGRTVTPGFIDAHAHMDREGLKEIFPSLAGCHSIKEIQRRIADLAANQPPGSWIVTMPIGEPPHYFDAEQGLAERRWPTRWDLDEAAPDHPVYIRAKWGFWHHWPIVSIANSRALAEAGITKQTKPPISTVTIELDQRSGEPTGIFREEHFFPLVEMVMFPQVPRFSHADRVKAMRRSMEIYASMGITSTFEGHGLAPELLDVYRDLRADDMKQRCYLAQSAPWESAAEGEAYFRNEPDRLEHFAPENPWVQLDGVYLPIAGFKELNVVLKPYLPYTGWAGFLPQLFEKEQYIECARVAMQHGVRITSIDANQGDWLVDAWAKLADEFPAARKRFVLGHLRKPEAATLRKMKVYDIVASTETYGHVWKDGEKFAGLPEEEQEILPHRSLIEAGIPFAFETDNCPPNPFYLAWSAVNRLERTSGMALGPRQRITTLDALHAMTVGGAYLLNMEDQLGSLAPGMLADLVILDRDVLSTPNDQLREVRPLLTMLGGKVVFEAPEMGA